VRADERADLHPIVYGSVLSAPANAGGNWKQVDPAQFELICPVGCRFSAGSARVIDRNTCDRSSCSALGLPMFGLTRNAGGSLR
jgi:hypothetical protein